MPFEDTTLIQCIGKHRNDVVDRYIFAAHVQDDPMADAQAMDDMPQITGSRAKAFEDAKVPELISVTMPAFTSSDGSAQEPITFRVVATKRRDEQVQAELTEELLNWMALAVHVVWDTEGAPWVRDAISNPTEFLPEPPEGMVYKRRGKFGISLVGYYRGADGKWKPTTRCLGKIAYWSPEAVSSHIRTLAASITESIERNHVEAGEQQPQASDAGMELESASSIGAGGETLADSTQAVGREQPRLDFYFARRPRGPQ